MLTQNVNARMKLKSKTIIKSILIFCFQVITINSFSQSSIEWQKSIGGTQADWPTSIQQTSDGGYVVAGWSRSNDGDAAGNHGKGDYWVVTQTACPARSGFDLCRAAC